MRHSLERVICRVPVSRDATSQLPASFQSKRAMKIVFANKVEMQRLLFAELSRMFGQEVPLYDKSLLLNKVCNQIVCALLAQKFAGFQLSEDQLAKTSGERHGAIRIGKPSEYRWVAGFFG